MNVPGVAFWNAPGSDPDCGRGPPVFSISLLPVSAVALAPQPLPFLTVAKTYGLATEAVQLTVTGTSVSISCVSGAVMVMVSAACATPASPSRTANVTRARRRRGNIAQTYRLSIGRTLTKPRPSALVRTAGPMRNAVPTASDRHPGSRVAAGRGPLASSV